MELHEFLYKIEGELPEGTFLAHSLADVVIVHDDQRFTPTSVSFDPYASGEIVVQVEPIR